MNYTFFKVANILMGLTIIVFLAGCVKHYRCKRCTEGNKPPIANAGKDTTIILPVNSVKLDGSGSSDPDGAIVSYHWKRLSGNSSFFHIENENASETLVTGLKDGEYIFALEIKDNNLLYASDAVVITVLP